MTFTAATQILKLYFRLTVTTERSCDTCGPNMYELVYKVVKVQMYDITEGSL